MQLFINKEGTLKPLKEADGNPMTEESIVVVSAFDEERGLVPVWYNSLLSFEEEFPYAVAVKSLTSAMIQEGSETEEMIIPFPAYSRSGFVYYFLLDSTPVSITFVISEKLRDLLYEHRKNLSIAIHNFVQRLKLEIPSYVLSILQTYVETHASTLINELMAILFGSDLLLEVHWFPSELRVHGSRLTKEEFTWIEELFSVKDQPVFLKKFITDLHSSDLKEKIHTSKELRYLFAKSWYIGGLYDSLLIAFHSFDVNQPPLEPFSIWYAASLFRKGDPVKALKILSGLSFNNDRIPELERLGFLAFILAGGLSQHKDAEKFALKAIDRANKSQDSFEQQASLIAHCALAISYSLRGLYEQVKEITTSALNIASNTLTSDRHWKAWLLNALSISEENRGSVEAALLPLYQAKEIFEQLEHSQALAIINNNLGNILYLQGKYEECLSFYESAYLTLQDAGDQHNAAKALSNLGRVYHRLGHYREALRFFERTYSDLQAIGDKVAITENLIRMGRTYRELGKLKVAEENFKKAKSLARETSNRKALAQAYLEVGEMLIVKDDYLSAEGWLNGALNAFKMFEIKGRSLGKCHLLLARCSAYQKQFDEAYQHLEKAHLIGLSLESEEFERKCKMEEELIHLLEKKH
ncbi:MAG: tetratricopeptide repeat protein [Candidatus Hermodarchaeota archaeon]